MSKKQTQKFKVDAQKARKWHGMCIHKLVLKIWANSTRMRTHKKGRWPGVANVLHQRLILCQHIQPCSVQHVNIAGVLDAFISLVLPRVRRGPRYSRWNLPSNSLSRGRTRRTRESHPPRTPRGIFSRPPDRVWSARPSAGPRSRSRSRSQHYRWLPFFRAYTKLYCTLPAAEKFIRSS